MLVGSKKAVWVAVNNMKVEKRNTLLEKNVYFDTMLPCVTFLVMVTCDCDGNSVYFGRFRPLLNWCLRQGCRTARAST